MGRIIQWVLSFVLMIAALVIINVVIVGGQKIWHFGDQRKLDELKGQLEIQRSAIEVQERDVMARSEALDRMNAAIVISKQSIGDMEWRANYNGYMDPSYSSAINAHNSWVERYNAALAAYQAAYASYSSAIDAYNVRVGEANDLAKKIGATWYLVPRGARPRFR